MKQKLTITLSIIFAATIIFFACNDEELPKITSINKIELTITEDTTSYIFAEIQCDLNQKPKFEIEQHGFCWDTVVNVNIENRFNIFGTLPDIQSFTGSVDNLLPNKTYYIKGYIQNGDVIIYSNELTIQTLDARPIVTTSDITNILANSAQSGGVVEAYETLFPITQRGVCWAKTQNPTIADSLTNNGTGNGTFTSQLQNLDIGVNYYVRAYAINSEGINYGEEKSFSALDGIPNLTTDSIRNITATSATFYGNIVENDGLEILEKGFCWSTTANPTISNNSQIVTGNALGNYNTEITGLEINTTYYIKSYLKNSEGTFYGNEISFTTEDGLPTITTTSISNITAISSESGGNISDDGGFAVTDRGVCWSISTNPTINDYKTDNGTGIGTFTSNITGLNVNTTYYVRAYATNVNGTNYGDEYSFTTKDGVPIITTIAIINITAISAESGGNITDDGGSDIIERGICWSTSQNPTIMDSITIDGTGTGVYNSILAELNYNTTYYVRAYATNSFGTEYGNQLSFTTNKSIPILSTNSLSALASSFFTTGGYISDDGGAEIVEKGVCWSTSPNPITSDNMIMDTDVGLGSFTIKIPNLNANTTYYVRAWAYNGFGIGYGDEIIITTLETVTDINSNVYNTVKIGNQIWTLENLEATHYNDGTSIANVTSDGTWVNLTTPGYCWYDNNINNKEKYGALYNYYVMDNSLNVCPEGWHVPSESEWIVLSDYLGGESIAGGKLKEEGTVNWAEPNTGATNESGFTALPAGARIMFTGVFNGINESCGWWSSTPNTTDQAWRSGLGYNTTTFGIGSNYKKNGHSIRCLKD